jgi:hypothetical protein
MPVLTLDVGATNLVLDYTKAGKSEPVLVGELSDAWDGAARSSIRAEKTVVQAVTTRVPAATEAAIRALFFLGARVPCAGDVFNNGGATVSCTGVVTSEMTETADWIVNLTLRQAT